VYLGNDGKPRQRALAPPKRQCRLAAAINAAHRRKDTSIPPDRGQGGIGCQRDADVPMHHSATGGHVHLLPASRPPEGEVWSEKQVDRTRIWRGPLPLLAG
jgi:hypothetical protein